jgi:hypothetical protein
LITGKKISIFGFGMGGWLAAEDSLAAKLPFNANLGGVLWLGKIFLQGGGDERHLFPPKKKPPPAETGRGHPKNQILRILKSVLGNRTFFLIGEM